MLWSAASMNRVTGLADRRGTGSAAGCACVTESRIPAAPSPTTAQRCRMSAGWLIASPARAARSPRSPTSPRSRRRSRRPSSRRRTRTSRRGPRPGPRGTRPPRAGGRHPDRSRPLARRADHVREQGRVVAGPRHDLKDPVPGSNLRLGRASCHRARSRRRAGRHAARMTMRHDRSRAVSPLQGHAWTERADGPSLPGHVS